MSPREKRPQAGESESAAGSEAVSVRIAGHDYRLRSAGDPEALQQIAGYVDRAMHRVQERTGTVDSLDVAVLTCLNLAREILALHGQRSDPGTISLESDRVRQLIERVEAVLASGPQEAASRSERAGVEESSGLPSEAEAHRSNSPEARASSGSAARETGKESDEGARTLELPTVEALRDRNAGAAEPAGSASGELSESVDEPRVAAAGGRDRAS